MACQTEGRVSEDESRPAMSIEDLMSAKVGMMSLAEPPMGGQNVPRYLEAAEG